VVAALGASETLAASGVVTLVLAIAASFVWTGDRARPSTDRRPNARAWTSSEPHSLEVKHRRMATFVLFHGAG